MIILILEIGMPLFTTNDLDLRHWRNPIWSLRLCARYDVPIPYYCILLRFPTEPMAIAASRVRLSPELVVDPYLFQIIKAKFLAPLVFRTRSRYQPSSMTRSSSKLTQTPLSLKLCLCQYFLSSPSSRWSTPLNANTYPLFSAIALLSWQT